VKRSCLLLLLAAGCGRAPDPVAEDRFLAFNAGTTWNDDADPFEIDALQARALVRDRLHAFLHLRRATLAALHRLILHPVTIRMPPSTKATTTTIREVRTR